MSNVNELARISSHADVPKTYSNTDPRVREWYRDYRERLHKLEWSEEETRQNFGIPHL